MRTPRPDERGAALGTLTAAAVTVAALGALATLMGCDRQDVTGIVGAAPEGAAPDGVAPAASFHVGPVATPITPDANTVLLDHFDGATVGIAHGPLGFGPSLSGLGQAGQFGVGNYVQYPLAGWYGVAGNQGTVEMWIFPNSLTASYETRLFHINWHDVSGGLPGFGQVFHSQIHHSAGGVAGASFWPSGSVVGATVIPSGQWTHLAFSWGPAGTRVYVNGALDGVGPSGGPSLQPTNYGYLNFFGVTTPITTPLDGLMDEFHISSVQRTDAEIAQHALLLPGVLEVAIDIKPGSDPNSVSCGGRGGGVIPVAILTTDDFDATTVDHETVAFGPDGATETHLDGRSGAPRRHEEDVDGDGDTDLVLHFRSGEAGIPCGDAEATLVGETFDGWAIAGSDAVATVG